MEEREGGKKRKKGKKTKPCMIQDNLTIQPGSSPSNYGS